MHNKKFCTLLHIFIFALQKHLLNMRVTRTFELWRPGNILSQYFIMDIPTSTFVFLNLSEIHSEII